MACITFVAFSFCFLSVNLTFPVERCLPSFWDILIDSSVCVNIINKPAIFEMNEMRISMDRTIERDEPTIDRIHFKILCIVTNASHTVGIPFILLLSIERKTSISFHWFIYLFISTTRTSKIRPIICNHTSIHWRETIWCYSDHCRRKFFKWSYFTCH